MKITFNNIAKVKAAEIELLGITAIGGENSVGKSTIGKALYAIHNSSLDVRIEDSKKSSVQTVLLQFALELYGFNTDIFPHTTKFTNKLVDTWRKDSNHQLILDIIHELITTIESENDDAKESVSDDKIKQSAKLIQGVLELKDEDIRRDLTQQYLGYGFHGQVNHVVLAEPATIYLKAQDQEKELVIQDNKILHLEDTLKLKSEAIYIDSLESITSRGMDEISSDVLGYKLSIRCNPNASLRALLKEDRQSQDPLIRLAHKKRLESITQKLNPICKGSLTVSDSGVEYSMEGSAEPLHLDNIAAGHKIFLVLKSLLVGEVLEQGNLLILDEPETHLHPKWQLALAELIVLIQKEYDMRILVTTHSPYFLRSLEVFAKRHQVEEKCRYYLAELEDGLASTKDVTGNVELIYEKLAAPLQNLQDIYYSDDQPS